MPSCRAALWGPGGIVSHQHTGVGVRMRGEPGWPGSNTGMSRLPVGWDWPQAHGCAWFGQSGPLGKVWVSLTR